MSNFDHLKLLREGGVEPWNSWRSKEEIRPDLCGAGLRGAFLFQADLREVDLTCAVLSGAELGLSKLRRAELRGADLTAARLHDADLVDANLHRSCLTRASLIGANLSGADLSGADLSGADLHKANLSGAYATGAWLRGADLREADLREADLSQSDLVEVDLRRATLSGTNFRLANLREADLRRADLSKADISGANLRGSQLSDATLNGANLSGADLSGAVLVRTDLTKANLAGCSVYGLSAWDVRLEETIQSGLTITPDEAPAITVDSLQVAQFVYLLLNNHEVRQVIDTITSKVVLILGRFTPDRKAILDAIRDELRHRNYLPVLFDFDKPSNRDITETVSTLAHMARFVIADITDAKSIPQELKTIVPNLPSVPVQPLLLSSQEEYGMFEHFKRYPWVLEPFLYEDQERLLAGLTDKVIGPAETKAKEQTGR
jgi:uncharacterized protein YjbI with pentapeptide repeats